MNLVPSEQDGEALHWLSIAKRLLGGELSPDDVLHALEFNSGDAEPADANPEPAK